MAKFVRSAEILLALQLLVMFMLLAMSAPSQFAGLVMNMSEKMGTSLVLSASLGIKDRDSGIPIFAMPYKIWKQGCQYVEYQYKPYKVPCAIDIWELWRFVFYAYTSQILCQLLFGIFLLFYFPNLVPYPGYIPIGNEAYVDNAGYEALSGGEEICPERHANIFSRILFGWMTPLMQQGYRRPISEKDVWKLDIWDQTETLNSKFQRCWSEESQRPKPWLLRALHRCVGGRCFTQVHVLAAERKRHSKMDEFIFRWTARGNMESFLK